MTKFKWVPVVNQDYYKKRRVSNYTDTSTQKLCTKQHDLHMIGYNCSNLLVNVKHDVLGVW